MQPISDNTLYYMLSTIAQAGAGAFGFLGAFVLFRLQTANSRLRDLASTLLELTSAVPEPAITQRLISHREYEQTCDRLGVSSNSTQSVYENYLAIRTEHEAAQALRTRFLRLVFPTLALVGASVLAIALVDQIKISAPLMVASLLTVFVMWFLVVLYLMGKVIHVSFS